MNPARRTSIASLAVAGVGCLWGLYWIPVRALSAAGWTGALGSVVIAALAATLLLPAIVFRRFDWRAADLRGVLATALGGAAFMLYSIALVQARVAIVILLFYLTPVWTTLIARFFLREAVAPLRYGVILLGLVGLTLTLGQGSVLPLPSRIGEWYALVAGLFWSIGSTGMNRRPDLPATESVFVFLVGALATALLILGAGGGGGMHTTAAPTLYAALWSLAAAGLWWIGSMRVLVWAAAQVSPTRVGILLMSEVLVGVLSAAIWADEALALVQLAGAALLIAAALLDVLSDAWQRPPAA